MDRDPGIRYCARYLARYILASIAVALFLAYIALSVSGALEGDPWDVLSAMMDGVVGTLSVKWVLAAVPMTVLAFLVGANGEGSTGRLVLRIVLNVYLAVLMVLVSSDPEYIFGTVPVGDAVSIGSMTIGMDALPITVLLLIIPASSMIDAVLEYREGRLGGESIHS